jgi:hypothetical protein
VKRHKRGCKMTIYMCIHKGKAVLRSSGAHVKRTAEGANSAPLSKGAKQGSLMKGALGQQVKLKGAGAGPAGAMSF